MAKQVPAPRGRRLSATQAILEKIHDTEEAAHTPQKTYPHTPPTPHARLLQSLAPEEKDGDRDSDEDEDEADILHAQPAAAFDPAAESSTVLYLAYGSNLSAQTFLGVRGIRPLSQVNVSAPTLRLTFDLPGIPYMEPCFANTALRKMPKPPPFDPPPTKSHAPPPIASAGAAAQQQRQQQQRQQQQQQHAAAADAPEWDKGLIGVVYEVTAADYAKIISTEGGGASYADIQVPCVPLPPSARIPEHDSPPSLPRPFLAHTLYSPPAPPPPLDPRDPRTILRRLAGRWSRPDPARAQPTLRYLTLLREGAREHALPAAYLAYLDALPAYTITTARQAWGRRLFALVWGPLFLLVFTASRRLADGRGRLPAWLAGLMMLLFNVLWISYDCFFERVFGDGERTIEDGAGEGAGLDRVGPGRCGHLHLKEKQPLLGDV